MVVQAVEWALVGLLWAVALAGLLALVGLLLGLLDHYLGLTQAGWRYLKRALANRRS